MLSLAHIALSLILAWPGPSRVPSQLHGRVEGLDSEAFQVVDLRLRYFRARAGGAPVSVTYHPGVELIGGRFTLPVKPAPQVADATGPLFVEFGVRPSGRRYAVYTPLRPRRPLRGLIDRSGELVVFIDQAVINEFVIDPLALVATRPQENRRPRTLSGAEP